MIKVVFIQQYFLNIKSGIKCWNDRELMLQRINPAVLALRYYSSSGKQVHFGPFWVNLNLMHFWLQFDVFMWIVTSKLLCWIWRWLNVQVLWLNGIQNRCFSCKCGLRRVCGMLFILLIMLKFGSKGVVFTMSKKWGHFLLKKRAYPSPLPSFTPKY